MTSPMFVPVFLEIRYDPSTPTQPQQTVVIPDRLANSLPIYGLSEQGCRCFNWASDISEHITSTGMKKVAATMSLT